MDPFFQNGRILLDTFGEFFWTKMQCWTKGRRSAAVAEDFRPTATATVAEV